MAGKIFGIGLSRTGTRSLTRALELLGFKAVHYPVDLQEIEENDAATDIPVAAQYQELDRLFPGSKFILTLRERETWLRSCQRHLTDPERVRALNALPERAREYRLRIRQQVYGTTGFEPKAYTDAYERHLAEVRAYFAERRECLLEIDICAGEGWVRLCPFLERPMPKLAFPRERGWQEPKLNSLKSFCRRCLGMLFRLAK
ncbi:MAG TPA: sulfotransferase [Planctomycetota bacterium]|jgi:hypothetical protein